MREQVMYPAFAVASDSRRAFVCQSCLVELGGEHLLHIKQPVMTVGPCHACGGRKAQTPANPHVTVKAHV